MTRPRATDNARSGLQPLRPFDDRVHDGKALLWLQVLHLMRQLDAPDAAPRALSELNRIAGWFDWETLAPREMTAGRRARLLQLLRLMAGTNSVGEASNAYRSALRMLQQNQCAWQWEAA